MRQLIYLVREGGFRPCVLSVGDYIVNLFSLLKLDPHSARSLTCEPETGQSKLLSQQTLFKT